MANYDKYTQLHNEIMKRLENGEITVEQAKEVNDLAFDKYIVERVATEINPDVKKLNDVKRAAGKWASELVLDTVKKISRTNPSNIAQIKVDLEAKSARYSELIKRANNVQDIEKIKSKIQEDIAKFIKNNK